jgi:predicted naringenin-chalcone synthase
MTDKYIEREVDLSFEVSDEALEAAAGSVQEKAGAFTLAFCSGLDTCPSVSA